jgi:protein-tyrosine phosphatase
VEHIEETANGALRMRVLMVYTGNICRSPTAAAVFNHIASTMQFSDRVDADSCGLHSYLVGESPDPRAMDVAKSRGIHIPASPARQIQTADFGTFDLIFAMDRGHLHELSRLCPTEYAHKLRLFLDARSNDGNVPDPYYGKTRDFEHALTLIEEGSGTWLTRIANNNLAD